MQTTTIINYSTPKPHRAARLHSEFLHADVRLRAYEPSEATDPFQVRPPLALARFYAHYFCVPYVLCAGSTTRSFEPAMSERTDRVHWYVPAHLLVFSHCGALRKFDRWRGARLACSFQRRGRVLKGVEAGAIHQRVPWNPKTLAEADEERIGCARPPLRAAARSEISAPDSHAVPPSLATQH